jgi:Tol biopolymer transport system component
MVLQEDSNIKTTQYDSGKQKITGRNWDRKPSHSLAFDEAFFTINRRGVCKNNLLVEKFHIKNYHWA